MNPFYKSVVYFYDEALKYHLFSLLCAINNICIVGVQDTGGLN